jgi:hypothetical protein
MTETPYQAILRLAREQREEIERLLRGPFYPKGEKDVRRNENASAK